MSFCDFLFVLQNIHYLFMVTGIPVGGQIVHLPISYGGKFAEFLKFMNEKGKKGEKGKGSCLPFICPSCPCIGWHTSILTVVCKIAPAQSCVKHRW